MKIDLKIKYIGILLIVAVFVCCDKDRFLDVRPDESMTVPSSLDHYQRLMDDDFTLNGAGNFSPLYPAMLEVISDNTWVPDARFALMDESIRAIYLWSEKPYPGLDVKDWNRPYITVLACNAALDGLMKIPRDTTNAQQWDLIRGHALFHRAHAFSMLTSLFVPAYDPQSLHELKGIPLRLTADVNEKLSRSTIGETYAKIVEDLREAIDLLPVEPLYKTRPSKRSCWALLSRVYLWMREYDQSLIYADLSLRANNKLMDYATYSTTATYPFPRFNDEVILNCNMMLLTSHARIDSNLYRSYHENDLRRVLFYKPSTVNDGYRFTGNYDGTGYFFAGLANDELYLNRAEAYARAGLIEASLEDLNTLLRTRWKKNGEMSTYIPYEISDQEALIDVILTERRRQLVWRGLRWADLKRINLEPTRAKVLKRIVNSVEFKLQPNDARYTYPLPDPVVNLNPNI